MLDYAALSAVVAVIREGSFEGAGRALRITASAVSQRVRGFEERLGALVIVRGTPCRATELGQVLCAHVDKVKLLEAEISHQSSAALFQGDKKTTLRLAVNIDSLATWLPDILTGYADQKDICITLMVEDVAQTADLLRSGDVMAAVTTSSDQLTGCRTVYLGAMHYVACASPDFVARYFPHGVTDQAIDAAPCICLNAQDSLQKQWLDRVNRMHSPPLMHYVPSSRGVLDFTLSGLGWGLQPTTLAAPYLAQGKLIELDFGNRLEAPLYLLLPRLKSSILDDLTRHLTRECSVHPALNVAS